MDGGHYCRGRGGCEDRVRVGKGGIGSWAGGLLEYQGDIPLNCDYGLGQGGWGAVAKGP